MSRGKSSHAAIRTDGGSESSEEADEPDYIYLFFKQSGRWILASIGLAFLQALYGEAVFQFAQENVFLSGFATGFIASIIIVGLAGIAFAKRTSIIQWHGVSDEDLEELKDTLPIESQERIRGYTRRLLIFGLIFLGSIGYAVSIQYIDGIYVVFGVLVGWAVISTIIAGRRTPLPYEFSKITAKKNHLLHGFLLIISIGFIFRPAGGLDTFLVIAEVSVPVLIGVLFPDVDVAFGKHRKTFHNLFVPITFVLFPIYFGELQFVWIGVIGHYILDLVGSVRGVALLYPLTGTEFGLPSYIKTTGRYATVITILITLGEILFLRGLYEIFPLLNTL